ncbi:unnamed protein product [Rotaria magnacalcarata]|uniref:F-box domain-containing protein n=1 Tax=Rotaria magnacalcarata TaxID=392030 RepID=A0A816PUE7_9BILA|nr:unnamed protein product [Rotaria magnacalcarata]CAF1684711.1 unnamed protein product [Rotaria magnacalcarata]CAF2053382.1 unnamed protein product [Rotaria magnacalcarata]
MAEVRATFIMDSGPFLDIIPTLLNYLDLKSMVCLAQTCRFWKERIYNDLKLWPKVVELPYIGRIDCNYIGHEDPETVIKMKLWSMVLPPEDPEALQNVLSNMALSEQSVRRFQFAKKVLFKNFIHTDESLRLTAFLFPLIEEISFEGNLLTIAGVRHIATSCRKLKHIEFYNCDNLEMSNVLRLFNTEKHRQHLERIFVRNNDSSWKDFTLANDTDAPFMVLCQRCRLYFNELKNEKEMMCLYHPGTYAGYGHSCSSFSCCGSNTPSYASTLGCQYTYHDKYDNSQSPYSRRVHELHNGHPEYMLQKYRHDLFPFRFTERRRVNEYFPKLERELKDV